MDELEQLERAARLWHIERAATTILDYVAGCSFDEYAADRVRVDAVQWQFTIIGEALSRALTVDPELASKITDARAIVALRNQLVHNYPRVNPRTIWGIIHDHLPTLLAEVRALLS